MDKKRALLVAFLVTSGLIAPALALENSLGEDGIDALRLHQTPYNLIGRKIAIGQVEIGRPGKFGFDKALAWNPSFSLAAIFERNKLATANSGVDNHANMVAMVMVSRDKRLPGVAPGARLYSSAVGSLKTGGQPEECLASQHIALQNGGDIRAINFSFGESLERDGRENASLDGNALLTQCIDWSTRVHDVLYVIAGNQGKGGIPIPTDNYNGITTAYTTKQQGKYTKVDFANLSSLPIGIGRSIIKREINVGPRRAVSLAAPGSKISLYNLEGKIDKVSGTSFAAPQVTASVALLQEFGDRQFRKSQPNWSLNYRRHEVMKAVLLNSADKIQDSGDGLRLGMNRTALTKDNRTWLESDAYRDNAVPLDIQLGTGLLDTFRAYQQFSAGEWNGQNSVPIMGWDYNNLKVRSSIDYQLDKPLVAGSFASVTLTWDRLVELNDKNNNKEYDIGETFRDRGLNNLNIYLMPVEENDETKSVCASVSEVDSVEHIFCQIPQTGTYKIRVQYRQQVNENLQPYALAWWTVGTNK